MSQSTNNNEQLHLPIKRMKQAYQLIFNPFLIPVVIQQLIINYTSYPLQVRLSRTKPSNPAPKKVPRRSRKSTSEVETATKEVVEDDDFAQCNSLIYYPKHDQILNIGIHHPVGSPESFQMAIGNKFGLMDLLWAPASNCFFATSRKTMDKKKCSLYILDNDCQLTDNNNNNNNKSLTHADDEHQLITNHKVNTWYRIPKPTWHYVREYRIKSDGHLYANQSKSTQDTMHAYKDARDSRYDFSSKCWIKEEVEQEEERDVGYVRTIHSPIPFDAKFIDHSGIKETFFSFATFKLMERKSPPNRKYIYQSSAYECHRKVGITGIPIDIPTTVPNETLMVRFYSTKQCRLMFHIVSLSQEKHYPHLSISIKDIKIVSSTLFHLPIQLKDMYNRHIAVAISFIIHNTWYNEYDKRLYLIVRFTYVVNRRANQGIHAIYSIDLTNDLFYEVFTSSLIISNMKLQEELPFRLCIDDVVCM